MRLLLIRHGDPDYEKDSLTEKGDREAALLAEKLAKVPVTDFCVSPLGRARRTAEFTLKKTGREAQVCDWLREFPTLLDVNGSAELQAAYPDVREKDGKFLPRIVWDALPGYWTAHPEYLTAEGWRTSEVARHSNMEEVYDRVTGEFDAFLAEHGYVREGGLYRAERENRDTLALFCHFGVSCVLLSRLWNVSPFVLWHSLAMAPTSVTEVVTEERREGLAYFRALRVGDISHLYAGNEEPSFACRFCETFHSEERH